MSDYTFQIQGVPTGAAPLDYKVSGDQKFNLTAIRALFDGTAAASAWLPTVQILSPAGTVMVETIGTSVLGGGSADASFFPLRRQTSATSQGFAQTVAGVAAAGTLRGYWRLGESAEPWADTSGWSSGPTNLTSSGAGAAPTLHVPGALSQSQDDGAVQINGGPGTGEYLHNASGAVNTGINSGFSIMAWAKAAATANNWTASIYNNLTFSGGVINGWNLAALYSGGTITYVMRRVIGGVATGAGVVASFGTWVFLVGTYDGSTLRLYSNGLLVDTAADARADTFNPYANVDLGVAFNDPFGTAGRFLGVLDEVAVWGTVLNLNQVQTLYSAAFA